jgi:hydrogenase expression/formation protein HypC
VSFDGIRKEVCLACVPDVAAGEYVVVHVGFAIGRIEESEARQVFELLGQLGELEGLGRSATPSAHAPATDVKPPAAPGDPAPREPS